jgi:4-hydroxy-tetrahydrodipicolinate synthase
MMTPEEFKKSCKGIYPVHFCPFTKEGEVDYEGLKQNTQYLLDFAKGGKDLSIMTNGSTAENYANSVEEQREIIKTVTKYVDGRIPVVAGTGLAGTKETIKMTKFAEEQGADCAMIVLPYYHKPTGEGMYKHYKEIAKAVNISIMIYNNPDVSGALIGPDLMHRLSQIENIVALKDNSPVIQQYFFNSALIDPEDMVLLNGRGEMAFVGSASYGIKYRGVVSYSSNFAPALTYDVYEAVMEKDFEKAQAALERMLPLFRLLGEFIQRRPNISILPQVYSTNLMFMSVGKAGLDLVGLNGGKLKLPLENLTADEVDELRNALEQMGVI